MVGLVATLGIAAGAFAFVVLRGTGEVLIQMVPSDATVYATVYLDPSAGQKLHLRSLVQKFPGVRTEEQLREFIDRTLDKALAQSGLSFERDVRPWLGSQIADVTRVEGGRTQQALLIQSTDDGAARTAMAKIRTGPLGSSQSWSQVSHGGVRVSVGRSQFGGSEEQAYALVGHTFVATNSEALLVDIIDTDQGRLGDLTSSTTYQRIRNALPSDTLGVAYVNARPLIQELAGPLLATGAPELPSALAQLKAFTGAGFSISAQGNGIAADFTIGIDRTKLTTDEEQALAVSPHESAILRSVPRNAYGLITLTGLRQSIQSSLNQFAASDPSVRQTAGQLGLSGPEGVVAHLTGDGGLEAEPGRTPYPAGALLVGTNDEAGMQRFLDSAAQMAVGSLTAQGQAVLSLRGVPVTSEASSPLQKETYRGVTITFLPVPELHQFGVAPAYAVSGGMAIVASSPEEAKAILDARAAGTSITSATNFRDATGGRTQNTGLMYFDVEAIAAAVRGDLPPFEQQDYDAHVAPNLRPVKAFLLTQENGPNSVSARIFVLIR